MDRDRLQFEIGNSISGLSIRRTNDVGQQLFTTHHRADSLIGISLNIMSVAKPRGLGPSPHSPASINSKPGFLSSMHCNEVLAKTNRVARKRFGPNLGRLGRNIRQILLCGFFQKVGTNDTSLAKSSFYTLPYVSPDDDDDAP